MNNVDIVSLLRGRKHHIDRVAADEIERLRKIEAAAVAAVEYEQWQGHTWYDLMIDLQKALHESIVCADGTAK